MKRIASAFFVLVVRLLVLVGCNNNQDKNHEEHGSASYGFFGIWKSSYFAKPKL